MSLDSAQNQRAAASDGGSMTQVMGRHWMIAAGHPLAAQAGARVLAAGGNAIDAGVAAGMTLGVVHPDMVSFAGVAPILVHLGKTGETFGSPVWPIPAEGDADFYGRAAAARSRPACSAPSVPARPCLVHGARALGHASFADAVGPALECAAQGFPGGFSATMTRANVERSGLADIVPRCTCTTARRPPRATG